jgi:hypothetical protein
MTGVGIGSEPELNFDRKNCQLFLRVKNLACTCTEHVFSKTMQKVEFNLLNSI